MLAPVVNAEDILAGRQPAGALSAKALNDSTFQAELNLPTSYFLGLLTHPIPYPLWQPAVDELGSRHVRAGSLVSNGAYRLEQWQLRSRIVLDKNPHYRLADEGSVDEGIFYPLEGGKTEVNRIRARAQD